MAVLGKYVKQPIDRLDYDFDYSLWIGQGDEVISAVFTVESLDEPVTVNPLTIDSQVVMPLYTKVWLVGGNAGETYKVSCTATTARGRVKQDEIKIRMKEY